MKKHELLETGRYYRENISRWRMFAAAYEGFNSLINVGLVDDFNDPDQYKRIGRAYGYNYSKQIVEIITGFIVEAPFYQEWGDALKSDTLFTAFLDDSDFFGSDLESFWDQARVLAGYMGSVGIMVNRSMSGNISDFKANNVYPYLSMYSPEDILNHKWARAATGRPYLSYVKVRQHNPDTVIEWINDDGKEVSFREWDIEPDSQEALLVNEDIITTKTNNFIEIPFFVLSMLRQPGRDIFSGLSLIEDIAAIDASIIRSAIRIDKIEHLSAYPMYVKPYGLLGEKEHKIGPEAVQEFDPETGEKPFWLSPEAEKAISPILAVMDKKKTEIYELSKLSGIITASNSKAARSGDSFKQMFRFLTSQLSRMVNNEAEARRKALWFWLQWQEQKDLYEDVVISHNKNFDTEKMVSTIQDILTEKTLLSMSDTATRELTKKVVSSGTLQDSPSAVKEIIYDEINTAKISQPLPVISKNNL